jgi:hypothetical protein
MLARCLGNVIALILPAEQAQALPESGERG